MASSSCFFASSAFILWILSSSFFFCCRRRAFCVSILVLCACSSRLVSDCADSSDCFFESFSSSAFIAERFSSASEMSPDTASSKLPVHIRRFPADVSFTPICSRSSADTVPWAFVTKSAWEKLGLSVKPPSACLVSIL